MSFVIPIFFRRLPGFFLLVGAVLLAGCASRDQPQATAAPGPVSPRAGVVPEGSNPNLQPTPEPRPKPQPTAAATPAPKPIPQARPLPTPALATSSESGRAQSLSALIQNGRFLRSEEGALIFAKTQVSNNAPSSLFEDAIILGRLRSRLNQIPGLPAGISESATVKEATADVTASADLSDAICAAVIDAALKTEGIAFVQIRF